MPIHAPPQPGPGGRTDGPSWIHAIRTRLFLSLALLAALLLSAASLWIERQARDQLEGELTLKLQAVGEAAVALVGPGVLPALLRLQPGQEDFAFYLDRRQALVGLRDRTGVRRIFLADAAGRSFLDTDLRVPIAAPLPQLRSDRWEMTEIGQGRPASAPLFTDETGQVRKTAYVPVLSGSSVIGLIGVEGDATALRAVRALRLRILGVGGLGILLAFGLSLLLSRSLSRPIGRLVAWARQLAAGDLSPAVPVQGKGEIAFLGRTLEQMRVQLEARDREQRAMVAGVAHEIRNPLGGIRLYTDLLGADSSLGEGARQRLEKIVRELDHLGTIVEEFLLYARPGPPNSQRVELEAAVGELVDWLRPQAEQKGVRLDLRVLREPRGGPVAQLDPNHLRQILRNLISNALDASPAGGIVAVSLGLESGVRISVEDEGPGIQGESRGRLFEPFYTTKANGAGLGLAIVRRLVLLNGGSVELEEGLKGGARFVLRFPEAS